MASLVGQIERPIASAKADAAYDTGDVYKTLENHRIDARSVTDEARFRDDLGADSLDAFELLMAFEQTFGLEIPDDDADPMQRVSDANAYIESHAASDRTRRPVGRATDSSTGHARS